MPGLIAEEDQLIVSRPARIEFPQNGLRLWQGCKATHRTEKYRRQKEIRNRHIGAGLGKINAVRNPKAELMIRLPVQPQSRYVANELRIARDEVAFLRQPALLHRASDSVKHALVSRLRIVAFVRALGRQDQSVNPAIYPGVRLRLDLVTGRSQKI